MSRSVASRTVGTAGVSNVLRESRIGVSFTRAVTRLAVPMLLAADKVFATERTVAIEAQLRPDRLSGRYHLIGAVVTALFLSGPFRDTSR